MIISEKGEWAVIQQGMNPRNKYARRYHWLSSAVKSYEEEPHKGIVGVRREEEVLDMTSKGSRGCKDTSIDLVNTSTGELERLYKELGGGRRLREGQRALLDFDNDTEDAVIAEYERSKVYRLPMRVNWDALRVAYDKRPENYEQFLNVRGVGPATVRALALISELMYGDKPSWSDPVKYSFAFGGKDGVPYPVDRRTMDETTEILRDVMKEARVKVKSIC
ncbi:hypothetical protein C5S31_06115 [ANME-1 cluster archaeon GoMg2]|nr:hypothetical protein [ANME-1 cluster archaeon GoMg2]